MGMVNELNSELAMAFVDRIKISDEVERQVILKTLRQVQAALHPLSQAARRKKLTPIRKTEESEAAGNH